MASTATPTPIEVVPRSENDVFVFEFRWELDATNVEASFVQVYQVLEGPEAKKIVFNFAGLKYIDSKSIGYVIDIYSAIERIGGVLYIVELREEVKDPLELVGVTSLVEVADTEAAALEALGRF